jgi:hypothetical protein
MGGLVTAGLFFVPETPRFLARAGLMDEASRVMLELRDGDEALARAELEGVLTDLREEAKVGETPPYILPS